jgi:hypothetical protein
VINRQGFIVRIGIALYCGHRQRGEVRPGSERAMQEFSVIEAAAIAEQLPGLFRNDAIELPVNSAISD